MEGQNRRKQSRQLKSERLRVKAGKVRFRARLGHLIYKAKHLTGEDVEREWGEFKVVSWRWPKLCVGEKSARVTKRE